MQNLQHQHAKLIPNQQPIEIHTFERHATNLAENCSIAPENTGLLIDYERRHHKGLSASSPGIMLSTNRDEHSPVPMLPHVRYHFRQGSAWLQDMSGIRQVSTLRNIHASQDIEVSWKSPSLNRKLTIKMTTSWKFPDIPNNRQILLRSPYSTNVCIRPAYA